MSTKPVSKDPVNEKAPSVVPMPPDPIILRRFGANILSARFTCQGRRAHFMNGICCLTTSSIWGWLTQRERFEAVAHSVRDVLSQRWIYTDKVYDRANPKRIYYLSMEFLIGRSLANNVTNLLLDPVIQQAVKQKNLDWPDVLEQEPDAGLGNGGLGRLAACFLDSMATMQLPAMGYGLRYEYGIFKQTIQDGWQREQPDNWLHRPDPWEIRRRHEHIEIKLNCFVRTARGQPACDAGSPFNPARYSVRSARRWLWRQDDQYAAALGRGGADYFDFQEFSSGDFVGALAETLNAESLTRVLYPDDSTSQGKSSALRAGIFSGCLLAGRSAAPIPARQLRLEYASGKSRHPA